LVPEQTPGTKEIRWHQTRPTGSGSLAERIAKKLDSEERLITTYGGTRVRMDLDRIPLWTDRGDVAVEALWRAYCQYPYLPRLASFDVLAAAISDGVSKLVWQDETFAYADGYDGARWAGLSTAQHVMARPSGFVVSVAAAKSQITTESQKDVESAGEPGDDGSAIPTGGTSSDGPTDPIPPVPTKRTPKGYYGKFALDSVRAIRQVEDILRNVVEHLQTVDGGSVDLTLEINAASLGYDDRVQRVVRENASQLKVTAQEFE
jgi:hypothetical protein